MSGELYKNISVSTPWRFEALKSSVPAPTLHAIKLIKKSLVKNVTQTTPDCVIVRII